MSDHGIEKKKCRGGRAHTDLQHYCCFIFVICPTNMPPLMAATTARMATVPIWLGFLVMFLILVRRHVGDPPAGCGVNELGQGCREHGTTWHHCRAWRHGCGCDGGEASRSGNGVGMTGWTL